MSNLPDLQRSFTQALLDPSTHVPGAIRGAMHHESEHRFAVHRNNVTVSLVAALAARFPVVERLVGEEFFRAMARAYVKREPPRSPVLLHYGATFPGFIEEFEPARTLAYLGDVARLELARGRAYHAADATPVGTEAFAACRASSLGAAA